METLPPFCSRWYQFQVGKRPPLRIQAGAGVEQGFSDIISQCELKKEFTAQGQIASKLIILQSRCEAPQLSMSTDTMRGERGTSMVTSRCRGQRAAAVEGSAGALQILETCEDLAGLTCLHVVIAVLGSSD